MTPYRDLDFHRDHNLHVIVRDIDWATGKDYDMGLPDTVIIPIGYEDLEDDSALCETINNYLSDNYGWLVNGYEIGWRKKNEA
jgi:hypothetical protein